MLKFLLLIGIWSFITALFYKLGKLALSNLSERKLIEIIGSQLSTKGYLPRFSLFKGWQISILVILFIILLPGSFWIARKITILQEAIFNTSTGYFIPHEIFLLFFVSLGIGSAILVLWGLYFLRNAPEIPFDKWENFPSLKLIHRKIKGFKNIGFGISLFLEICFLGGMTDYVIIEKDKIRYNPLGTFTERIVDASEISFANLTYDYRTENNRNGSSNEVLEPEFKIYLKNEAFNIWYPSLDLSDSLIEKIAFTLHESDVKIKIDYPGIMERAKWHEDYSESEYDRVMSVYDYGRRLTKGFDKNIKIGEIANVDNLKIRVDSAIYSRRANIFDTSDKEPLLIYFTVTNHQPDTTLFATLLYLKVYDETGKGYMQTSMIHSIGDSEIPPTETVQIMRGFRIPDELKNLKNLKVRYILSLIDKDYVEFNLK